MRPGLHITLGPRPSEDTLVLRLGGRAIHQAVSLPPTLRLGLAMLASGAPLGPPAELELAQALLRLPVVQDALLEGRQGAAELAELDLEVRAGGRGPGRAALAYLALPGVGVSPRGGLRRPGRWELLFRLRAWWGQRSVRQRRAVLWVTLLLLMVSGSSAWRRVDLMTKVVFIPVASVDDYSPEPDPVTTLLIPADRGEGALDHCAVAEALEACAALGPAVIGLHVDRLTPGPGFAALTLAVAEVEARGVEVVTATSWCPGPWALRGLEEQAWCGLPPSARAPLEPLLEAEREGLAALGWRWHEAGEGAAWVAIELDRPLVGDRSCEGDARRAILGAAVALARVGDAGEAGLIGVMENQGQPWALVDVPPVFDADETPPEAVETRSIAQACRPGGAALIATEGALAREDAVRMNSRVSRGVRVPPVRVQQAMTATLAGRTSLMPLDVAAARWLGGSRPQAPSRPIRHLVQAAQLLLGLGLWWALPRRRPLLLALGLGAAHALLVRGCVETTGVLLPHAALSVMWLLLALIERRGRRTI